MLWLFWKMHDSWFAYFRTLSRRNLHRLHGRAQKVLRPTRRVQFSKATLRHANFRNNQRSIAWGDSSQKILISAVRTSRNFEDRPQEETERQERCARGDAWRLVRSILKLKEKDKATFSSLTEVWFLPAPTAMKPEGREFVVDSGASVHNLSRKDVNSAELETVEVSRSRTTVVTAHGEVQTKDEATVYVKEFDLFVTVKLLEDTPAVLSLGKLCEDHGYSCEWTSGPKPQLIKNGRRMQCSTENYFTIVVPGLSTGSSSSATLTSPASLPQEAVIPSLRPASTGSESMSSQAWRDPSPEPTETEKTHKNEDNDTVRGDPVACSARRARIIYGKSCGRKSSSVQGRIREFFSWISFRAARESGVG